MGVYNELGSLRRTLAAFAVSGFLLAGCTIGSIPAETAIRTATIQYGSVGATVYADSGWTGILR